MQHKYVRMLAATALIFMAGCLSVENINTPAKVQAAASSDRSLVYGRVRWIENGAEPNLKSENFLGERVQRITPRLKRAEENSTVLVQLDGAGHFVWSLKEGTYIMDMLTVAIPGYEAVFFVPKVAFRVPENGKSYYIGTLRADAAVDADFWGTDAVARFSVVDEMRSENAYTRKKLGTGFATAQKSLMVQNENLPESFDTTEEFRMIMLILGAPW